MQDDARERAWAAVHDAIAAMPGWAVSPTSYHGEAATWHVAAVDLRPTGRQAKREAITATGATEMAALDALAGLLEDRMVADPRAVLNRELRAAFVEGAEEDSRRRLGRGLTEEELERVLRHYPGDVETQPKP
jgi:hypothetical protein